MRSKSARTAFPWGLFLHSACAVAIVICAGACLAIARGAELAYGTYAAFLLLAAPAGGGFVALSAMRAQGRTEREAERRRQRAEELEGEIKLLEEAADRREEFIASFAHELKTPLTAIIGYADMLRSREMSPKNRFTAAGYIFSEGKRLEALSLKLMEIIVSGKQGIERRRFDAPYFIREVAAVTVPSLAADGMTLDMRWEPGEVEIESDLFKTLMINLIDNARKASRKGQTVELFGKREEGGYAFYVRDHGRGMKKEDLSRITEPFYMIDKSRSRAQNGAGLGLALCQRIAELHGTALEYESEPGQGTTVRVYLKGGRAGVRKPGPGAAAAILTALVFAVCLAAPALMLRARTAQAEEEPAPTEALSLDERVELYESYDAGELARRDLDEAEIDNDTLIAAVRLANALETSLVADRGAQRSLSSTGTNFYTVSDGEGAIRIMEYYREWIGDWSNWFWVKLNIDTLEVFYCYYSAACERNLSDYDSDDYYNVSAMIMDLAGAIGFDGFDYYTRESVTDNMPFEVDITNSVTGESLRYECRMHTYSDAASLLVDREYTLAG